MALPLHCIYADLLPKCCPLILLCLMDYSNGYFEHVHTHLNCHFDYMGKIDRHVHMFEQHDYVHSTPYTQCIGLLNIRLQTIQLLYYVTIQFSSNAMSLTRSYVSQTLNCNQTINTCIFFYRSFKYFCVLRRKILRKMTHLFELYYNYMCISSLSLSVSISISFDRFIIN